MPKISACIISFNEEQKIEDCLRSLEGIADEIIVVDSLSTDRTIEIVGRYTDRIYHQKFLGHVEQKNLAVSHASHDWILSLDCDERLSPQLRQAVLDVKDALDEHCAYRMPRKTFYVYRWLEHCWYPDRKVRLFNRRSARWGGTNPHDRVVLDAGVNVADLKGDILHYSFSSISEHLRTIDSFTEIGAREIIAKGKPVSLLSPLSHGLWTFFRLYILKRGFLDGFAGFVVATLSFMHAFIKYAKVLMHQRNPGRSRL
ncbi:MAG: glycosyltransferase family 2 protein [Pseudomonadota bacterium]